MELNVKSTSGINTHPRSHPVRLVDIAREVGVSVVTVAKVLNDTGGRNTRVSLQTAQKIRACASCLDYQPNQLARQLAGKSSDLIGIAVDSYAPAVFHTRLALMEQYASSLGYRFLIGQAHESHEKIISFARDFVSYNVAGILCLAHNYPRYSSQIAKAFPLDRTVFLDKPSGILNACHVSLAIEDAFCKVVHFLLSTGRKRPVLILREGAMARHGMNLRKQGYLAGIQETALEYSRVVFLRSDEELDFALLLRRLQTLLSADRPDAIIASNDHMAAAILQGLLKLHVKVPEDVALTGFDNIDFSRLLTPSLTTFDDCSDCIAKAMVNMLIELIHKPDLPAQQRQIIIQPELIVREST